MPNTKKSNPTPPDDQAAGQSAEGSLEGIRNSKQIPVNFGPSARSASAPKLPPDLLNRLRTNATPPGEPAPTSPAPPAAPDPAPATDTTPNINLDDSAIDAAIEDITRSDSDELLAIEDSAVAEKQRPVVRQSAFKKKLRRFFKSKWTYIITALILVAAFAWPFSRYKLLDLVMTRSLVVSVVDSKTGTPVSSANVSVAGQTLKTDANGTAVLHVGPGDDRFAVSKQYYTTSSGVTFVGLTAAIKTLNVDLVATGRQVPISVVNSLTGQSLSGVSISVAGTQAKTNAQGQATIVLPASANTDTATLALSGYNSAQENVQVTSTPGANKLTLTPGGELYFLSNDSGTIDVVKTNLDGSNRQTVLPGTGKEDPNNTILLASPDWQYLVLEAERTSAQPALYLINTATGQLTEFDSNNATFSLIGWSGDTFLYDEVMQSVPASQAGHELLKSYNASDQELDQLGENQVITSGSSYAYQAFGNFYISDGQLIYTAQWYNSGSPDMTGQVNTINGILPEGQDKKTYLTVATTGTSYFQSAGYQPGTIYYSYTPSGSSPSYYTFQNDAVTGSKKLTAAALSKTYSRYFISPSGKQAFWDSPQDGQYELFTGDENAQQPHTTGPVGNYKAFGWYTDSYLLMTANNGQLYIMPTTGNETPHEVSDYYVAPQPPDYGYEMLAAKE
jgi:hypothetical protein